MPGRKGRRREQSGDFLKEEGIGSLGGKYWTSVETLFLGLFAMELEGIGEQKPKRRLAKRWEGGSHRGRGLQRKLGTLRW